ncbi:sugar ABC transporter ATP-binding protein [uncultured Microbacterium sp.]|uniref:sugar ABC transporter ATP-binding protein n=1 Tax=uncultured Microbacterium sp. TaxID=191216 RepID=UPI0035C9D7FE
MSSPADDIVLAGISKTFGTARVVDDVSIRVRPGRIHALLGGNGSGKSTLLKMLAGVYRPDAGGTIRLFDAEYPSERYGPGEAMRSGLRFVHQDLALIPDLSIAENIALGGRYPLGPLRRIRWRRLRADTALLLRRVALDLDPDTLVGALRPSDRALVAIARAFSGPPTDHAVLVLDEPTASLPHDEVERLLQAMRDFRAAGHSVVFVSHHLPEVFGVADDVTVLRDGRVVATGEIDHFDHSRIVTLMAGHAREAATRKVRASADAASPALSLRGFHAGPLSGVDLDVRRGEILGIAGLLGSGRSSLLGALFGDLPHGGDVRLAGGVVRIRSTIDAVAAGIAYVPEDRRGEAAFLDRSVWENMSAVVIGTYLRMRRIDDRRARADARDLAARFHVRAASIDSPLESLSGGNQQKVILARWLRAAPRILLLDEPTQGVDVVARDDIHDLIRERADDGAAVLMVSSDLDELELLCDRVAVLRGGRLVDVLDGDRVTSRTMTQLTQSETGE